jgi:hypothetical protein
MRGTTLHVGTRLRASMGANYPAVIAQIAAALRTTDTAALALRPVIEDRRLGEWEWRLVGAGTAPVAYGYGSPVAPMRVGVVQQTDFWYEHG